MKKYLSLLILLQFFDVAWNVSMPDSTKSFFADEYYGNADIKDFPHHVIIGKNEFPGFRPLCSGALANNRFIITSGNCVYKNPNGEKNNDNLMDKLRFVLGSDSLAQPFSLREINKQLTIHSKTKGLVWLFSKNLINFETGIGTINIAPEAKDEEMGTETSSNFKILRYTGFGATEKNGTYSTTMKKIPLAIVTSSLCKGIYNDKFNESQELCVGWTDDSRKGIGVCDFEGGGILTLTKEDKSKVGIGIHLMGNTCNGDRYMVFNSFNKIIIRDKNSRMLIY